MVSITSFLNSGVYRLPHLLDSIPYCLTNGVQFCLTNGVQFIFRCELLSNHFLQPEQHGHARTAHDPPTVRYDRRRVADGYGTVTVPYRTLLIPYRTLLTVPFRSGPLPYRSVGRPGPVRGTVRVPVRTRGPDGGGPVGYVGSGRSGRVPDDRSGRVTRGSVPYYVRTVGTVVRTGRYGPVPGTAFTGP